LKKQGKKIGKIKTKVVEFKGEEIYEPGRANSAKMWVLKF
jgi:hypothetical protein